VTLQDRRCYALMNGKYLLMFQCVLPPPSGSSSPRGVECITWTAGSCRLKQQTPQKCWQLFTKWQSITAFTVNTAAIQDLNPPLKQILEVLVTETEVNKKTFISLRLGCEVSFQWQKTAKQKQIPQRWVSEVTFYWQTQVTEQYIL
jgi:hypothetical protein